MVTFVVDTQTPHLLPVCKKELHTLLEDRELSKLPLLILANKIDLEPKISEKELIVGTANFMCSHVCIFCPSCIYGFFV